MYYYNETVEGFDNLNTAGESSGSATKNKWLLPVGIGVGVLVLVGIVILMRKKKPTQKFGFKFY
jgi:hypothetical protein